MSRLLKSFERQPLNCTIPEKNTVEFDFKAGQTYELPFRTNTGQR
jgi:hypothetical protein